MTYRVEITELAAAEIRKQYEWLLANRSKFVADRFRDALLAAIDSLEKNPERCPKAPEAEWYGEQLRHLIHHQRRQVYRVLFEIHKTMVIILRVRHHSQDVIQPTGQ
jgi:plasmid stabilization system protein ParE